MKIKRAIAVLFISAAVFAAASGMMGTAARAQGSDSAVAAKLEQVIVNQKAIMEDLAAIKEELRIIKIRITQSQ